MASIDINSLIRESLVKEEDVGITGPQPVSTLDRVIAKGTALKDTAKDAIKTQAEANPKTAGAIAGAGLAAGAIGAGLAAKKYLAARKVK